MVRKIIHVDMDAFFASIEQRDHPEYRNRPLVVGGSKERGVIAAASYEARKFGIHSAMPSVTAKRKCPHLIFAKSRFEVYKSVSAQIMEIFRSYTDLVEPLSLDEAFLDVTSNKKGLPSATLIAQAIKKEILETTGLTASAGISVNKFLAKVASDQRKPDGIFLIKPDDVEAFIQALKIEKFFGVGEKTAEKMHRLNIHTGKDLLKYSLPSFTQYFGKAGLYFYNIARGIDDRPVNPNRIRKSIGVEHTFSRDIETLEQLATELEAVTKELKRRMDKQNQKGKTLTLKLKFNDFEQITRSKSYTSPILSFDKIADTAFALLSEAPIEKPIRLMGLSVSNFPSDEGIDAIQLTFDFD